jgi:YVTN family beta-propeller protein
MIRPIELLRSQCRFRYLALFLLALLSFAWCPAYAQAPPPCLATFTSPLFVPVTGTLTELIIDDQCEHVYLTNVTSNTVEVYSLLDGSLRAPIQVGSSPTGLDTSPDGKTLYVANSGANNISVVDLTTRVEKAKVPVPPDSFINDTPFSLAVAKNGLVFFSTTFAGSGFGGRMLQLDPASTNVTLRPDFFAGGSTTEATFLRASGDRSAIGVVAGDISSAPVFRYSSDTNLFSPEKDLNGFVSYVALDQSGSTILVNPGTYVLDGSLNLSGSVPGGSFGVAVDPSGAIGYQVGSARNDVLDLKTLARTDSLEVGDSLTNANGFSHGIGQLAISRDGTVLAVITDHGFSLVQTKVARFVGFASMSARADLHLRPASKHDSFKVDGTFTLDQSSNGIDPSTQEAVLQVGSVSLAIPAGSFQSSGHHFRFEGTIDGVALKISLHALGANRYRFSVHGENADLSGSSIPLKTGWVIGDDRGSATLDKGEVELRTGP